jgi:hypothetical protein
MLIIARPRGRLPPLSAAPFEIPEIAAELKFIDVQSLADLYDRRIGTRTTLAPYFFAQPLHANSDYYPILDQQAVKSRFLNDDANALLSLRRASARLEEMPITDRAPLMPKHDYLEGIYAQEAPSIADYLSTRVAPPPSDSRLLTPTISVAAGLLSIDQQCDAQVLKLSWLPHWIDFGVSYLPYLPSSTLRDITTRIKSFRCYAGAPEEIRDWIAFFDAIASDDMMSVTRLGLKIMATYPSGKDANALLAREMLLAIIRAGDFNSARALVQRLDPAVFEEPSVDYLRAYAAAH